MAGQIQWVRTITDTPERQLAGLSDMEIVTVASHTYLLAAGAAEGGISSFELLPDGTVVSVDDILLGAGSGTQGVSMLDVFTLDGAVYVLPSGEFDDNQTLYSLGNDGAFSVAATYADGAGTYAQWGRTLTVDTGTASYLYGSVWGQSGFFRFDIGAGGALANQTWVQDTPQLFLGDITAMESAVLHGKNMLFVASGQDAGLHSFLVGADGALALIDTAPPLEGGFSGVTDLVAVDGMDRSFVVLASAGTDALVVFRVSAGGRLQQVQGLVDTADTRFGGVTALETFDLNGRDYVLAGGADDGVTLFEITYKGQLKVIDTFVDTAGTALQNVTDIVAQVTGGVATIFISSATDQGFSQLTFALPGGDNLIRGGPTPDTLTGTAGDDTIFGHGMPDTLKGLAGDDRLVDGRGPDILWGGSGADIFEFVAETKTDTVMDFEIGIDRLDLSDYAMLYNINGVGITPTADGAVLTMGGDTLVLHTMDGSALTADMFIQGDFIFG